jgi:hypothetical protein
MFSMKRSLMTIFSFLVILSMLAACAPAALTGQGTSAPMPIPPTYTPMAADPPPKRPPPRRPSHRPYRAAALKRYECLGVTLPEDARR